MYFLYKVKILLPKEKTKKINIYPFALFKTNLINVILRNKLLIYRWSPFNVLVPYIAIKLSDFKRSKWKASLYWETCTHTNWYCSPAVRPFTCWGCCVVSMSSWNSIEPLKSDVLVLRDWLYTAVVRYLFHLVKGWTNPITKRKQLFFV